MNNQMKLLLIIIATGVMLLVLDEARASEFCDGYEAGYGLGWNYKGAMVAPPMPTMCPAPESVEEDNYDDGVLAGIQDGLDAMADRLEEVMEPEDI